ncbi:hypothetical protein NE237_024592 [Protea cynaroides]|uniref:Uncharacterized protein n=1 Tax=Protea cynaroides TaxID=273540 RepID=A0A9Q0JZC2_9MAGN|nr:hypothetical protein NE237_024592 [Protea cynaroides]
MEPSKAIVVAASSPSEISALPPSESDSQLSNLICDVSQQLQAAMGNILKMIQEVDQTSSGIVEEIEKCKESAMEKKKDCLLELSERCHSMLLSQQDDIISKTSFCCSNYISSGME